MLDFIVLSAFNFVRNHQSSEVVIKFLDFVFILTALVSIFLLVR